MIYGWKEVHDHVCKRLGEPLAFDTVRRWAWLTPALGTFNGKRIRANVDKLNELLDSRIQPKAS